MNDNKRRAIVWDTIERIAFRPNKPERWLSIYARTLHKLWDIESMWVHFGANSIIDIPFLKLQCDYIIENVEKYSILLIHDSSVGRCYWQNHIDPEYLSKGSLHSVSDRYPRQQRAQLQRDIAAVLNGMVFHPRCHAHLEDLGIRHVQFNQDSGGLSSHEVRIGGGIENPYVFLFHIRYQFCLVADQVRQTERQRLIDLFENAIRNNLSVVTPSKLLNFQGMSN